MADAAKFPEPVTRNGRKFFIRHQLENYKRALAGLPLLPENTIAVVELVRRLRPPANLAEPSQPRPSHGRREPR